MLPTQSLENPIESIALETPPSSDFTVDKQFHLTNKFKTKLKKIKISANEYAEFYTSLHRLGYADELINKMVMRKHSRKSIHAVCHLHNDLNQHFSHKQIAQIAAHQGGEKNLSYALEALEKGMEIGFSKEEVLTIIGHDGGKGHFKVVMQQFNELRDLELSIKDIVTIASHAGGNNNITAIITHFHTLEFLGFSTNQIIKIVSHGGGAKNIEAVVDHFDALNTLKFNIAQIVKIACHGGGSKNIIAVKENFEALHALGFTVEDIIRMVSFDSSAQTLISVKESFNELTMLGLSLQQIVSIVSHAGGHKNINALKENMPRLLQLEFTAEQIVKILGYQKGSGHKNLKLIANRFVKINADTTKNITSLLKKGKAGRKEVKQMIEEYWNKTKENELPLSEDLLDILSIPELQTTASLGRVPAISNKRPGDDIRNPTPNKRVPTNTPKNNIINNLPNEINNNVSNESSFQEKLTKAKLSYEMYLEFSSKLIGLKYDIEQIDKILLRRFPKPSYDCICILHDELIKIFTHAQITTIAARTGGALSLQAIYDNIATLNSFSLDPDDIVRIAKHEGGAKNIEAFVKYFNSFLSYGFCPQQIISILNTEGGFNNLTAVLTNITKLFCYELSTDHIVKIAQHHGGSQNILAVIENLDFFKEKGFTIDDIVKIAGNNGGALTLQALKENLELLYLLHFNNVYIVKMAAHNGGAKIIEIVRGNFDLLLSMNFTPEQIIKIVNRDGGSQNIITLKKYYSDLQQFGFSNEQITKILSGKCSGEKTLKLIIDSFTKLSCYGTHKISKILASGKAGRQVLENLCLSHQKQFNETVIFDNTILNLLFNGENINEIIITEQLTTYTTLTRIFPVSSLDVSKENIQTRVTLADGNYIKQIPARERKIVGIASIRKNKQQFDITFDVKTYQAWLLAQQSSLETTIPGPSSPNEISVLSPSQLYPNDDYSYLASQSILAPGWTPIDAQQKENNDNFCEIDLNSTDEFSLIL